MYSREKIILMTKLSQYDKTTGKQDKKKHNYFRSDYVYRQNMWMRFYIWIGLFICVVFRILHKFSMENFDIYNIELQSELVGMIYFAVIVFLSYTIIGTIIYTVEYEKAGKRLSRYHELLSRLDRKATKKK